jgi:hypothetical protein
MEEHFIPLSLLENSGTISACSSCSNICHYHCCKQQLPRDGENPDPSNSLLLYPGEWETQSKERKQHIRIMANHVGGKLGYCDAEKIDQSQCAPLRNFKPLDCKSYPFFPAFVNNELVLLKDRRCPLTPENEDHLDEHYLIVLKTWKRLITENPQIAIWIMSLSLPDYDVYYPNIMRAGENSE